MRICVVATGSAGMRTERPEEEEGGWGQIFARAIVGRVGVRVTGEGRVGVVHAARPWTTDGESPHRAVRGKRMSKSN